MVLKPSKSILAITFCWLCLTMAAQNSWQAKVINKDTELPPKPQNPKTTSGKI